MKREAVFEDLSGNLILFAYDTELAPSDKKFPHRAEAKVKSVRKRHDKQEGLVYTIEVTG